MEYGVLFSKEHSEAVTLSLLIIARKRKRKPISAKLLKRARKLNTVHNATIKTGKREFAYVQNLRRPGDSRGKSLHDSYTG